MRFGEQEPPENTADDLPEVKQTQEIKGESRYAALGGKMPNRVNFSITETTHVTLKTISHYTRANNMGSVIDMVFHPNRGVRLWGRKLADAVIDGKFETFFMYYEQCPYKLGKDGVSVKKKKD